MASIPPTTISSLPNLNVAYQEALNLLMQEQGQEAPEKKKKIQKRPGAKKDDDEEYNDNDQPPAHPSSSARKFDNLADGGEEEDQEEELRLAASVLVKGSQEEGGAAARSKKAAPKKKKKTATATAGRKTASPNSGGNSDRKCSFCEATVTPMWRHGPEGYADLCNKKYDACFNVWYTEKYLKGIPGNECEKLFEEYKECVWKTIKDKKIDNLITDATKQTGFKEKKSA